MKFKKLEKYSKYYKPAILVLSLAFVFFLVYSIHSNYQFPFHTDEWQHIAQAVSITEKGYGGIHPYFKEEPIRRDYEVGFHLFLSELFLTTGMDPILHFKFLPALFAVIAAFILFVFISRITNFMTGIFSILFFAGLKSNVNILGLWFFLPLTIAIPLLYLLFFVFSESLERRSIKLFYSAIFILFAILFLHGLSAVFAAPLLVLYTIIKFKKFRALFKEIEKHYIIVGLLIALFFSVGIILMWHGSFSATLDTIKSLLVFESGWTNYEKIYNPLSLYAPISLILVFLGLVRSVQNPRKRFFLIWAVFVSLIIAIFYAFKVSFLVPYQRALYYAYLALVPLSAFGLNFLIELLKKASPFKKKTSSKKWLFAVSAIIVISVFTMHFSDYYEVEKDVNLYHHTENYEYDALKWLENNYGTHNVVLAMPGESTAIYPISKSYVWAIIPAQLGGGIDVNKFFSEDNCDYRKDFLKQYPSDFVYSKKRIICDFLKEVYTKKVFIYEVREYVPYL